MTPEQIDQIVEEAMLRTAEALNPEGTSPGDVPQGGPPGVELPVENVDIAGEKVNYRIVLNPEIFFRYSVFEEQSFPIVESLVATKEIGESILNRTVW